MKILSPRREDAKENQSFISILLFPWRLCVLARVSGVRPQLQTGLLVMNDIATLQEQLLQWLSSSPTARAIDREIGDLNADVLNGTPAVSYLRCNVDLRPGSVQQLDPALQDPELIASLSAMDAPANMGLLHGLGTLAAQRDVRPDHFPGAFHL